MIIDKIRNANKAFKLKNEINKQMGSIFVTLEKQGVKVVLRGDKHIERIEIDGEESKRIKDVLNDAFKDADKKAEKIMRPYSEELGLSSM